MKIKCLTLGAYQTNTYLVYNNGACVIIDPGYEAETILDAIDDLGLKLEAILLTHGHFDHVGAVKALAAETDCAVYIHKAEDTMPPMMTAGKLHYTHTFDEGDVLELAGLTFTVMHTPGHTPGSVCLVCGTHMFSGDTLFAGSCGRIDLPGGNASQMRASLNRLAGLEGNVWIYPGHGGSTCLRDEKRYNPYLGGDL